VGTGTHQGRSIDLSADVGELTGDEGRALDLALIGHVTTAHLACGGHAGDPRSMRAGVEACLRAGTRVGAHPSYDDRAGFGRMPSTAAPSAVAASVVAQLEALVAITTACGGALESVKPHGQLYHDLEGDEPLQEAVFSAINDVVPGAIIVLGAGSAAAPAAHEAGLVPAAEGFMDRRYDASGRLVPRGQPGAVLEDPEMAARQAVLLATAGVQASSTVLRVDSLCVHSDSPTALAVLVAATDALRREGLRVRPIER